MHTRQVLLLPEPVNTDVILFAHGGHKPASAKYMPSGAVFWV